MGAGLDLDIRLKIIREIYESSDSTTVRMKDRASGPEGLLPFIQAVLGGLADQQRELGAAGRCAVASPCPHA
ncbi:hypothetical protein ABZY09_47220 [Streptomyces sp. NPDC002928]|uniref:hypothetical protein n=1 Tax=Streptomyces sp. NPDC002928 TaxID=3154440 RepID=UPI0033B36407